MKRGLVFFAFIFACAATQITCSEEKIHIAPTLFNLAHDSVVKLWNEGMDPLDAVESELEWREKAEKRSNALNWSSSDA